MRVGRPKNKNIAEVLGNTVIHVPLTPIQKSRLAIMAVEDHRKMTDFIRLLLDREWERREKTEQAEEVKNETAK